MQSEVRVVFILHYSLFLDIVLLKIIQYLHYLYLEFLYKIFIPIFTIFVINIQV